MENKMNKWIIALVFGFPGFSIAQFDMSVSFGALNGVTLPPPVVSQNGAEMGTSVLGINPDLITTPINETEQISSSASTIPISDYAVLAYPASLYIQYSVPTFVCYDWKYVQNECLNLLANGYGYTNVNLQSRLCFLAYTDFLAYSNYKGFQQKLEFRAGSRVPFQYSGDFPPVIPNSNPVIVTKIFAAP